MSHFSRFILNMFFKARKLISNDFNMQQLKEEYGASGKAIIKFVINDTQNPNLILFNGVFKVGEKTIEQLDDSTEYNVEAKMNQQTFMLILDGKIVRKYPNGNVTEAYDILDAYREGRITIHTLSHDIDYLGDLRLLQFLYPKIYSQVKEGVM